MSTHRAPGPAGAGPGGVRFRRPVEADHAKLVAVVDEWWGGRHLRQLLPRLWLQHFAGTSWIAETEDGRLAGFLVGFLSPDHPDTAYAHMIATNPNLRGRGIGRALYQAFIDDTRGRGARRIEAITWPGNRVSLAFHAALGFHPVGGPATRLVYGTPAFEDYEADGEVRTVLVLVLDR